MESKHGLLSISLVDIIVAGSEYSHKCASKCVFYKMHFITNRFNWFLNILVRKGAMNDNQRERECISKASSIIEWLAFLIHGGLITIRSPDHHISLITCTCIINDVFVLDWKRNRMKKKTLSINQSPNPVGIVYFQIDFRINCR